MSRHSNLPQGSSVEDRATSVFSSRWLRLSAAAVAVAGGIMAASTAVDAWAAKSAVVGASSASAVSAAPGATGSGDAGTGRWHARGGRFCQAMHGGGMGHGGMQGMHGMMPGGRHLDRMLDAVKATEAQRDKIHTIAQAAHQDLDKLHEQGRTLREQAMGLMAQAKVDAVAAEAQRQKMLAHHDAVSKRMMTAMLDTAQVLTPEQRATLAEHMKQRQERREHWPDRRGGQDGRDGDDRPGRDGIKG
jgi:periplasmic protein CpxP/Spy